MEHTDQFFQVEKDIFPHVEEPRGLRLRSAQVWAFFTSFFSKDAKTNNEQLDARK